ncbi:MAG TPA: hypothetical protein VNL14_16640 [Candidatus Acidoferrales bacterium]|nr:hypothetical protein [Candidatus Acidoferrales bacterium]
MPRPEEIIAEARTWLEVPWVHQGRSRHGVDCLGLPVNVAHHFRLTDRDYVTYGYTPNWRLLYKMLDEACIRVKSKDDLRLADVPVFWMDTGLVEEQMHLGIVADGGNPLSIIHCYRRVGKVCENVFDQYWIDRIDRIYRFKGVW